MPPVGREAIKNGLLNLHRLFSQAPTLGSLINPAELPADLIAADYETIQPYLAAILAGREGRRRNPRARHRRRRHGQGRRPPGRRVHARHHECAVSWTQRKQAA